MSVSPVPDAYRGVTPYLVVDGAARAIAFYKAAFGANEQLRLDGPDGRIGHAELRLAGGVLMLSDAFPEMNARDPKAFGGTPVHLLIYVDDADAVVARAVAAGATLARPVADQFYGDRSGMILDPFGHSWTVATHKEDVSPDELRRRHEAANDPSHQG